MPTIDRRTFLKLMGLSATASGAGLLSACDKTSETPVKVGEEVEVAEGAVMTNFTSKSLGRTFESIIFSSGVVKR